ncbi:uncharacterized protein LOC128249537 [Octopus bimaculoides]|uniref:uncharacterized protein LOC128249537 n=1 Tax=Octopus bimaculoides TaxID=37653 RepID=UPI0022E781EC|nr:uncharacterized protein LOC128249537 [Octopus bimaculoides]
MPVGSISNKSIDLWPSTNSNFSIYTETELDVVQFNISIDYTVSEAQKFPVDYYLISYHIKMSQFLRGQQFNPEGINQTQKSRTKIYFLNNCSLQSDILDEKGQQEPPGHNFTVVVNGLFFEELDIYVYKIRTEDRDFNFTTEPNTNSTKKRIWYLTLEKYWELWISCILMILTVILSITSLIHWCYKAYHKNQTNWRESLQNKEIPCGSTTSPDNTSWQTDA